MCHEYRRSIRQYATVREMEEGPSRSAIRLISSHRKLLSSKAMVVSVAETAGQIPSGKVERGERKQTADDVSKTD